MIQARPFEDASALLRLGERIWWSLTEADHREAYAAHPKIGEAKVPASGDATWSTTEQSTAAAASAHTLAELAAANQEYDAKHGFIFIVCATGRSAETMLADLRRRLTTSTREELHTAAEEQAAITRLRLTKLIGEIA
jgi:OHCU decarboxylase